MRLIARLAIHLHMYIYFFFFENRSARLLCFQFCWSTCLQISQRIPSVRLLETSLAISLKKSFNTYFTNSFCIFFSFLTIRKLFIQSIKYFFRLRFFSTIALIISLDIVSVILLRTTCANAFLQNAVGNSFVRLFGIPSEMYWYINRKFLWKLLHCNDSNGNYPYVIYSRILLVFIG